jgi:hypothetical protein
VNKSDIVNGIFELGMACMLAPSVRRLWIDRCVKGWSINSVIWPTLWGFYNLYFYPHNGLYCSFLGGLAVVLVNSTWVGLALYFKRRAHP